MNRPAFLRSIKAYAKANGMAYAWKPAKGKGGHGTVSVAGKFTTVPTKLNPALCETILKQLGLPKHLPG